VTECIGAGNTFAHRASPSAFRDGCLPHSNIGLGEFSDDLSRYRTGARSQRHGHRPPFALGLVSATRRNGSVKTRCKSAGWDQLPARNTSVRIAVNVNSMPSFTCGGGRYTHWPIRHSDNNSVCFFKKGETCDGARWQTHPDRRGWPMRSAPPEPRSSGRWEHRCRARPHRKRQSSRRITPSLTGEEFAAELCRLFSSYEIG